MHIIRSIICLIILSLGISVKATEVIGIEAKEYDNVDAFVFYHTNYLQLNVSYINGVVNITCEHPIKFRKLTPVSINSLTNGLKNLNDKTITFSTKANYQNFEIINGEKLTALKFKTDKKFDKVDHKIQALNKLDNPTSGMLHTTPESDVKEVVAQKVKNGYEIKFEFDEKISAGAFQRGDKLLLGFNKKVSFNFPPKEGLKPPFFLDVKDATILSIDIPQNLTPSLRQEETTWILSFKDKAPSIKNQIKTTKLLDHYGIHLDSKNLDTAITFQDPISGDIVTLITTKKPGIALAETHYFNDFTVYSSIAGCGVSWVIDNFNAVITKDGAEIFTINNAIFSEIKNPEKEQKAEEFDASNSLLPFNFGLDSQFDFVKKRGILYRAMALTTPENLPHEKYNLAKFFFAEQMLPEALGTLELIEHDKEFIKKHPESPLFKAVALSLSEKYQESQDILKPFLNSGIKNLLKAEATIWYNYNQHKLGEEVDSIGVSKYINAFISQYPDFLYWPIIFSEFEISTNHNNHIIAEQLFRTIKAPNSVENENSLNYFKASFYRKNGKNNLANNYYDSIKSSQNDPKNYARAELDQTDMLLKSGQIKTEEAIARLEKLKFIWRGDELEYKILMKLSEYEESLQNFVPALRTYKYVLDSFPNSNGSVYITHQMANIYNNFIFSKGGVASKMEDFDLVALFYEFRELTPIGAAGDKIVLMIAKRLINLDLLDEAEQILSHQIKYRLTGKDKIITGDHLAAVYIMNKKPDLAVEILKNTDLVNHGFLEHISRQRLKAKAYLDLKNYQSVLEILQSDDSSDSHIMKEGAYFKSGSWENYALLAESKILPLIAAEKILPENHEKEAFRLAISYSMQNKLEELKYLASHLKTHNTILQNAIKFIASTNNPIDVEKLENKFNIKQVDKYLDAIIDKLFNFK